MQHFPGTKDTPRSYRKGNPRLLAYRHRSFPRVISEMKKIVKKLQSSWKQIISLSCSTVNLGQLKTWSFWWSQHNVVQGAFVSSQGSRLVRAPQRVLQASPKKPTRSPTEGQGGGDLKMVNSTGGYMVMLWKTWWYSRRYLYKYHFM